MSSMSPYQSSVHANYNTYCWCLSLVKHEIKDHFPLTQQLAVLPFSPLRILITVHKNDFIVLSLPATVSIEMIIVSFPPQIIIYYYWSRLVPTHIFTSLTCLTFTFLYSIIIIIQREIWWVKYSLSVKAAISWTELNNKSKLGPHVVWDLWS